MPSERPAPDEATERDSDATETAPASGETRDTPSSVPPGNDDPAAPKESKRRRFESRLPGLIRRGIEKSIEAGLSTFEKSIETGRETTETVREVFSDVKIPDIANAVGKALQ